MFYSYECVQDSELEQQEDGDEYGGGDQELQEQEVCTNRDLKG